MRKKSYWHDFEAEKISLQKRIRWDADNLEEKLSEIQAFTDMPSEVFDYGVPGAVEIKNKFEEAIAKAIFYKDRLEKNEFRLANYDKNYGDFLLKEKQKLFNKITKLDRYIESKPTVSKKVLRRREKCKTIYAQLYAE